MAVRGAGGPIATALGVAAGAGAAQLGLGYGLGVIAWLPTDDIAGEAAWVASLAWAAWIAATSTVAGAICADRLHNARAAALTREATLGAPVSDPPAPAGNPVQRVTGVWRAALAVAAASGALITVALVAVPARAVTHANTYSPQTIAAGYAATGVLLGLVVAFWALSSRAVAANVMTTISWLWLLAVIAVIDKVASGRDPVGVQLGVWQFASDSGRFWFRDYLYWPGAVLSLGSAFVIGALAAWKAARHAQTRVGATASGVVGPLLVAGSYFLTAPQLVDIHAAQLSAHLIAPYAVIAGLAGSVLMATLTQRAETRAHPAMPIGNDASPGTQPSSPEGRIESTVVPAQASGQPAGNSGGDLPDDAYAPTRPPS